MKDKTTLPSELKDKDICPDVECAGDGYLKTKDILGVDSECPACLGYGIKLTEAEFRLIDLERRRADAHAQEVAAEAETKYRLEGQIDLANALITRIKDEKLRNEIIKWWDGLRDDLKALNAETKESR